jgi:sirohydrochlorin ferrochelatase
LSHHHQKGVLVIAHGSRDAQWVSYIDYVVSELTTSYPVEVGYLEMVEGKSIQDAICKLEALGVVRFLAVPLFVSSGSTHLDEIRYALGLQETPTIETDLSKFNLKAIVDWAGPMDTHPFTLQLIFDRIEALSIQPKQEQLLVIGHGSDETNFGQQWEEMLATICEQIENKYPFKAVTYATLHPDTVREKAEELAQHGRPIVLPIFISEGYFTRKLIPRKLEGLSYVYDGKAYIPHPLVSEWLTDKINNWEGTYVGIKG